MKKSLLLAVATMFIFQVAASQVKFTSMPLIEIVKHGQFTIYEYHYTMYDQSRWRFCITNINNRAEFIPFAWTKDELFKLHVCKQADLTYPMYNRFLNRVQQNHSSALRQTETIVLYFDENRNLNAIALWFSTDEAGYKVLRKSLLKELRQTDLGSFFTELQPLFTTDTSKKTNYNCYRYNYAGMYNNEK